MSPADVKVSAGLAAKPINQFMTRKVIYATISSTVEMAITMMVNHEVSGLPILDATESCVGVYSELDAVLQASSGPLSAPIRFTKPAHTVKSDTPFRDVLIMVATKRIKRVPVVDDRNKLVGVVSRHDLMKALLNDAGNQVKP